MKKSLLIFSILLWSISTFAQYPIGHRSITYIDAARANRSIPVEVYYPGASTGDNVAVQIGSFPIIAFGHGFMMGYGAYAYWKDQLVPSGYIVVFPTTEGGTPDHAAFGADLAFLVNQLKLEGANAASPFYQRVGATSAIMGHSMGGGASFLACENNIIPNCMITFAAANTTPSSINAAAHITIPSLVIAGEDDCVAPPAANQQPMYDSLASACKVFVGVKNGAHCYFGDYNFTCTLGESTCNPVPSIVRADQLATTLTYTRYFLDYELKGLGNWAAFLDTLSNDADVNYQVSCSPPTAKPEIQSIQHLQVFPNPARDLVQVIMPDIMPSNFQIRIINNYGQTVLKMVAGIGAFRTTTALDVSELGRGSYQLILETSDYKTYRSLLILQ